jgi:hypothetical protein
MKEREREREKQMILLSNLTTEFLAKKKTTELKRYSENPFFQ